MSACVLRIQNCYSWLITDNEETKITLWKSLRFRDRNYFHNRAFRAKVWDGYVEFIKKETGRFLTGLLPEVEAALKHLGIVYEIEDARVQFGFLHDKIDISFLDQWLHLTSADTQQRWEGMRDYQPDLVNQIIKHKRGVIYAPTSAGKTAIMVAAIKALPKNVPTLVLANKKSLSEQNYAALKEWGVENVGRLYDKYKEPNMITCANVQSLHKLEKLLPKIKVLMVDEIHEMMSKQPKKYYNKLAACSVRVAFSATPFKFDGKDKVQKYSVKGYFGPILKTKSDSAEGGILTTKKLQEKGILSSANCVFYPVDEPELPYAVYQDAVTKGIAENWLFHRMVTRLVKTLSGRSLILVERLDHGDALKTLIPDALWVRGEDNLETRKMVIEQLKFAKGDIVGIATQGIFNTGLSVYVMNLINAASGQAEHMIIQRFGRGLRTAVDKSVLNYYDFIFSINPYLFEHSEKRIKILKKEGHNVDIRKEIDF
jgi:superfamily II DNA or RNA helicase